MDNNYVPMVKKMRIDLVEQCLDDGETKKIFYLVKDFSGFLTHKTFQDWSLFENKFIFDNFLSETEAFVVSEDGETLFIEDFMSHERRLKKLSQEEKMGAHRLFSITKGQNLTLMQAEELKEKFSLFKKVLNKYCNITELNITL